MADLFVLSMFLMVICTSMWVLIDSSRRGIRKRHNGGFFDMGPAGWFFSCLLLWIVAFPAYLIKRNAPHGTERPDKAALDNLQKLAALRSSGALTEAEFDEKKKELLKRV